MSKIKIYIQNNTGYALEYDKSKSENDKDPVSGKKYKLHGSTEVPDNQKTISNGAKGYFYVKGNSNGANVKMFYKILGSKDLPSPSGNAPSADYEVAIYVQDSVNDNNPHHVRAYPGTNSPDYFFGDYNASTDFSHCSSDDADLMATVTLGRPVAPNKFIVVSDLHFGSEDNGEDERRDNTKLCDFSKKLSDYIRRYSASHLGVIVNGDNNQEGDDDVDDTEGRSGYEQFEYYFYQEEKFDTTMRSVFHGPIYEGSGNHDNDQYGKVKERNESEEVRRWMVHYKDSHYSWEWLGIRFIQLNMFPGNGKSNPTALHENKSNFISKDSHNSMDFLKEELKTLRSGQNYVVCFHFGLQDHEINNRDWGAGDRDLFYDVIKDHKPICIFNGHIHYGGSHKKEKYTWNEIQCYNTAIADSAYNECYLFTIDPNADAGKIITRSFVNVETQKETPDTTN